MFKFLRRLLLFLIVGVIVGYGAAEVYAKGYAERKLVEIAEGRDPLARGSSAQVSTPLIAGILRRGIIDRIEMTNNHVDVGPLYADQVTAVLTQVEIDRVSSLRTRSIQLNAIGRLEMSAQISQEEASKVLPRGLQFRFEDGKVVLAGGGAEVRGKLELVPPASVRFAPDAAMPPGIPIPSWKFDDIPYVTCIRSIQVFPGVLEVTCIDEDPPPSFPPIGRF